MSTHIAIADAIVTELQAASLSQAATIQRRYLPEYSLRDLADTCVTVVPTEATITAAGRTANYHDFSVDVAVQRRVEAGDIEALDDLMQLTEEISDALRLKRLAGYPNAAWLRSEVKATFAQEHLNEHQVFTSVLTVTFRTLR